MIEEPKIVVARRVEPQCESTNPDTDHRCTMAPGHAGPHVVGSPYHPDERWVTPCKGACKWSSNSDSQGARWVECVICGQRRSLTEFVLLTYLKEITSKSPSQLSDITPHVQAICGQEYGIIESEVYDVFEKVLGFVHPQ